MTQITFNNRAFYIQTGPQGPIIALDNGQLMGGSGYVNNTYTGVPLTGGHGSGAQATIIVSGNAVISVTITANGTGYVTGDTLSASNANLGGSGSGFSIVVLSVGVVIPLAIWVEVDGGFDSATNGFSLVSQLSSTKAGTIDSIASNIGVTTDGGTTWTLDTTPQAFGAVVASGSNYIGLTTFPFTATYSPDGVTWTAVGSAPSGSDVTEMIYDINAQTLLFVQDNFFAGSITNPGSGYTDSTYFNVTITGGSGTGLQANITVSGGGVTQVMFTAWGIAPSGGYVNGDIVSANSGDIGGGAGFQFTISNVTPTVDHWQLASGATSFTHTLTNGSGPSGSGNSFFRTYETNGLWLQSYVNNGGQDSYLYKSTNGGASWTSISIPAVELGPFAYNGTVYCMGAYTGASTYPQFYFYTSSNLTSFTPQSDYPFDNGGMILSFNSSTLVGGTGYTGGNGTIYAFSTIVPGSSYVDNTYYSVSLTGGSGSSATADITVSGGQVVSVNLDSGGSGYSNGDVLSANNTDLGGSGSGFTITVSSLIYSSVPLTGGSGSGAIADIVVTGGSVSAIVNLDSGGLGYALGDVVSASNADLGGSGSGFQITVAQLADNGLLQLISFGSIFVATDGLGISASSNNAVTWSTPVVPTGLTYINGIYVNGSKVYTIGDGISSSTDGITWTNELTSSAYIIGVLTTGSSYGAGGAPIAYFDNSSLPNGSGYVDSTYTSVPLTGGSGASATANIVVSGGQVTSVTLVAAGTGYVVGDTLSASNANLGGSGSGFSINVQGIQYTNVPLTGGSGAGAQADIVITTGGSVDVRSFVITNYGSGYVAGNTLSASNSNLGGSGSGFTASVTVSGMIIADIMNNGSTFLAVGQQGANGGVSGENGIWRHS